jgi:DNA polymerase elongation subunit (family B)
MSEITNQWHGKVITFNEIRNIPSRSKFLDKTLTKKVASVMENYKPLLFMPNTTYDNKAMQDTEKTKAKYKLVLFGILENGAKTTVIINGIIPFVDVKIPDDEQKLHEYADEIKRNINALTGGSKNYKYKVECIGFDIVQGKPSHGFQEHQSNYIRFYFDKISHRKDAIVYLRSKNYVTSHDDLTAYYRVASRDALLPLGRWLVLQNYSIDYNNKYLKGRVIQVDISDIKEFKGNMQEEHLRKDNTMTMAFDIETFNPTYDRIADPEFAEDCMFMISMTFQYHYAHEQLLSVCLVDVPTAPNPDFLTIVCGNEKDLIRGFAMICAKMQPEIIMGFNADKFDWKWIVERAMSYKGVLSEMFKLMDPFIGPEKNDADVAKYHYKKSQFKIEVGLSIDGQNLQFVDYISVDAMIVFRKLNPTSEQYSLNFFLKENKLEGKEDMPYREMFDIYRDTLAHGTKVPQDLLDKMALVAKYCVVDSLRVHELMNKRTILRERREVASLSYTSLSDAFYYADGMKVRNLTIAEGSTPLHGLMISNIADTDVDKEKYPGALVFPPKKGLYTSKLSISERIKKAELGYEEHADWLDVTPDEIEQFKNHIELYGPNSKTVPTNIPQCFKKMLLEQTGRPISGLDYSSLYPSLMMAYNLSPEYMVTDRNEAKRLSKLTMPDGTKKYNFHWVKFPYNGETIHGWSVRHDNKLDPSSPDYRFGLFPSILCKLRDQRNALRKGPNGLEYYVKRMKELKKSPDFNNPEVQEEYKEYEFNAAVLDAKQRALKVFMNTFYGETGNKRSSLFMIQVAGGITTAGQKNIKRAYDFVESNGCNVYYGDSVTGDTPILIRYTHGPLAGTVDIRTIDDIPALTGWIEYPQFKPYETKPIRVDKQMYLPQAGLETWTHNGWQPIRRIIRHKTIKSIMRVSTIAGTIDVTEDHSLLNKYKKKVSPKNVKIGDELYHSFPVSFFANSFAITSLSRTYAYILGIFHANGYANDNTWYITGQNVEGLGKIMVYMRGFNIEGCDFKISSYMKDSYKLECIGNASELVNLYRTIIYDKEYKVVPIDILNASSDVRKSYWDGFYVGCYDKNKIQQKGKIGIQGLYYLLHSLGHRNVKVSLVDNVDQYQLDIITSKDMSTAGPFAITSIIPYALLNDYVYDIETAAGSFLGGVGSMVVSNTDSLYISPPESIFEQMDKEYYSEKITKLEYWTKMVNATFANIHPLANDLNTMLANSNGTNFLKMAYEETLFPLLLLAKKKYVGIPHEETANFDDVELFIKGLELKKRGVSKVMINICLNLLHRTFDYKNILTVLEIIKTEISKFYNTDWESEKDYESLFVMTDSYKPDKQNAKMHTFYNRMLAERNIKLPAYERVQYIVIKKYPYKFDLRGRKKALAIGDRLELLETVKKENLPIDVDYYIEKRLIGQFARFITYFSEFSVEIKDLDDMAEVKKADTASLERAKKYLNNYCKQYYSNYSNKGDVYKKIFSKSDKIVRAKLVEICGGNDVSNTVINLLDFTKDLDKDLETWLDNKVAKVIEAKKKNKEYGRKYVNYLLATRNRPGYLDELHSVYYGRRKNNILDMATANYNERQSVLKMRFNQCIGVVKNLYYANNITIEHVSSRIKEIIDIDNSFNVPKLDGLSGSALSGSSSSDNETLTQNDITDMIDLNSYIQTKNININEFDKSLDTMADEKIRVLADKISTSINELKFQYFNLLSNYEYIYQIRSIVEHLKSLRDKKLGIIKYPTKSERAKMVSDSVEDILKQL